ncbi:MAG: ATP-binding cassette domain-containing protein [Christensenella sp.]|nr:ATP-binding cassette domain-containing protein [Christensenella sp.]
MSIEICSIFIYNKVMCEVLLKVEDLSMKYFGGNWGVKVASFSLNANEHMVLLGKSLSGKTSLLRAIAGLEKYNGNISFSKDVSKNLAFSFDLNSLPKHDKVYDVLAYPLIIRKENNIDEIVKAQAKKYKLNNILDCKVNKISQDYKKILLLARCMIRQNDLYLIDNPLKDMDEKLRQEIFEIFLLDSKDKCVIYSTDNYLEAIKMNCKIAIMAYSQLIQFDTLDNLTSKPKNRMVLENLGHNEYIIGKLIKKEEKFYAQIENEYINVLEPICDIFINKEILLIINNNIIRNDIYFDKDTDYLICKME